MAASLTPFIDLFLMEFKTILTKKLKGLSLINKEIFFATVYQHPYFPHKIKIDLPLNSALF